MPDGFPPLAEERQGTARYLAAFREHWLLIAALAIVAVAAAAAYSYTATKRYEASTDLLVTPVAATDETFLGIGLLRESSDPQARTVLTAARLIGTPEVAREVERRLRIGGVLDKVEVKPAGQSNIVTIVGKSDTPEQAAAIANTFLDVLIDQRTAAFQRDLRSVIDRLEGRLDAVQFGSIESEAIEQRLAELRSLLGTRDPTLAVASRAEPPGAPVWPRPKLSIAVALLAALLLGGGIALGLELLSPRVKREEELLLEHRLPILARVPRLPARTVRGYLTRREPLPGEVWEAYRTLRASLVGAGEDGGFPRTLLVTSAMPGEGKTMTSVNLSITMALAGVRVVLVDGDLRRPMVAPVFGVASGSEGFASALLGKSPSLVSAPGHADRLRLLLAAPEHVQVIDLLEPRRVKAALDRLSEQADVVIIDSPPLTEVADALPLADAVDAVLVTARLGHTRRDKLTDLRRMLSQHGVVPKGFVVTSMRRPRGPGYYGYRGASEAAGVVGPDADARPEPVEPRHVRRVEATPPRAPAPPAEAPGARVEAARELAQHAQAVRDRERELAKREATVEKREHELAGREREVGEAAGRANELDKREQELAARARELRDATERSAGEAGQAAARAKELGDREQQLAKREAAVESRARELTQRERELRKAADDHSAGEAGELAARMDALERRERRAAELEQRLTRREEVLAAAESEREGLLSARERELREAEQRASREAKELTSRADTLAKRERATADHESKVARRDEELARAEQQAKQAQKELADRAKAVERQERQISDRSRALEARERELAAQARPAEAVEPKRAAEPARPADGRSRIGALRNRLLGTAERPPVRPGLNGEPRVSSFDMSLPLRLTSAGADEAERFGHELATYIQSLYAGSLEVEDVAAAADALRLTFHVDGLTEQAASSFGDELATYVRDLYGETVAVGDIEVRPCGRAGT